MKRLELVPPCHGGLRTTDAWGSGAFGAPRGDRLHAGVDFAAFYGDLVRAPCSGVVRRLGVCYADDPTYRLVEIDAGSAWVRVLYVSPDVQVGDQVHAGTSVLGTVQDVASRYGAGMTNHVHLDVRLVGCVLVGRGQVPADAVYVDPCLLLKI